MALAKILKLRGVLACALMVVLLGGVGVRAQEPAASPAAAASKQKQEVVKDESDEYRHSATVQKMGSMIGMKPEAAATTFTLMNLLILAVGVGYMLLKLLPKAFRDRSSTIQKDLVSARTATEEASARLGSVEARLAKLDDQIAAMRAEAEAASKRDELRIKASVEDEKAKILAAVEAEIQSASTLARRSLQKYAAELAIDQASKKLIVTAETDRLLVESFAHRLFDEKAGKN